MAKGYRSGKPNATGRNNTSRFVRLPHSLLVSNAYRALSPNERALLVELAMLYNGKNNGSLYLGVRDGAHRIGLSDLTATSRAFDTLRELGFIDLIQEGRFVPTSDTSRARVWRLTWEPGPGRKAPTWEFLEKEPEAKSKARKRMERGQRVLKSYKRSRDRGKLPVLDSNTQNPFWPDFSPGAVSDSNTKRARNGCFPIDRSVQDSDTHTATTIGSGAIANTLGWWQPDSSRLVTAWSMATIMGSTLPHPH